ncbi:unnamed protein product, partial [Symbiodinium pilosum]
MRALHRATGEADDQALMQLVLLEHPELGQVDVAGRVFLTLHGHKLYHLERTLCSDRYWARRGRRTAASLASHRRFNNLSPPRVRRSPPMEPPVVLHFNGNGKRLLRGCFAAFRKRLLVNGPRAS